MFKYYIRKEWVIMAKSKNSIILIALSIYAIQCAAYITYSLNSIMKGDINAGIFTVEVILPVLTPAILFGAGFLALKNKGSIQNRVFDGLLLTLSCMLLSIIIPTAYDLVSHVVSNTGSVQLGIVSSAIQLISAIVIYYMFIQARQNTIPRYFQFYFITLTAIAFALQLIYVFINIAAYSDSANSWDWTASHVIPAVLTAVYLGAGYKILSNIPAVIQRLFYVCIATTLAIFTAFAFAPFCKIFDTIIDTQLMIMMFSYVISVVIYMITVYKLRVLMK